MPTILPTHGVALVQIENAGLKRAGGKKSPKIRHLGTIQQVCLAISSQLRHISTMGKNLLNSNSPTWPYNMVNFGLLAAEIVSLVWGTPANFILVVLLLTAL